MNNNFISENGIVAVPGDEDQFMNGNIRRIRHPLSKERGHIGQIRFNDANCQEVAFSGSIGFNLRPLCRNQGLIDKLAEGTIF